MSTPTDSQARFDAEAQGHPHGQQPDAPLYAPGGEPPPLRRAEVSPAAPHPDNPPWGILVAVGIVIGSLILMLLLQFAFIIPYALSLGAGQDPAKLMEVLQTDKNVILLSILAVIPAHLLTLLLCWLVVTGAGKRPFWRTLGWGWSPRLGATELVAWFLMALALLGVSFASVRIFGNQETDLERWLMSSQAARYAIAALATFTAPIVEEVVYRGVLYSALRRRVGEAASVVFVLALFAAIHVPQYKESWAAITTIVILSLVLTVVRARTGRLLPCVVIHFFFNGITSLAILYAGQSENVPPTPAPPTPTGALLYDLLSPLLCLFT